MAANIRGIGRKVNDLTARAGPAIIRRAGASTLMPISRKAPIRCRHEPSSSTSTASSPTPRISTSRPGSGPSPTWAGWSRTRSARGPSRWMTASSSPRSSPSARSRGGTSRAGSAASKRLTVAMLADSPRIYPGAAELVRRLSGPRPPGGRLDDLARESRRRAGGLRAGRCLRSPRGQGRRRGGEARPRGLSCWPSNGCGCPPERRSPSRTRESGLQAARGAGLRAIAVGHRKPLGEWVGPSQYVPDLTEASNLIGLLGLA